MPFTLTHVAAVVPVKQITGRWLPFTALALGSMVPDVPMFLQVSVGYTQTHSLAGLFTFCLPIGLALYALFQVLVRTPLVELMPNAISDRLGERSDHTIGYVLAVAVAITIGAGTHVLWDAFTHGYGKGVQMVPALKGQIELFNRPLRYYTLLQHGSSVVLLPLMAWWLYRWATAPFVAPAKPYQSRLSLPLWVKLAGCSLVFVVPAAYASLEAWFHTQSFYYGIGQAARSYGRYLIYTALVVSVLVQLLIGFRQDSTSPPLKRPSRHP